MEEGADSGAIISQVPFNINFEDNAKSLCEKVESIAQKQICDFTAALLSAVENPKNIAKFGEITPKNNSLEKNQPESTSQDSLNLAGGGGDTQFYLCSSPFCYGYTAKSLHCQSLAETRCA